MAGIADMVKGGVGPAQPQEPEGAEADSNVTPEEQALYDRFVTNAYEIIYPSGGEATVSPQVLQALKGGDNAVMNLATAAVTLVKGLQDSADKAGQTVPDDVLYHAGAEIVEELAEVAEAAKIHDYSEDEIEQAFYMALDMYRAAGTEDGSFDTEGAKEGWGQLVEADRQGRAGEMLPGVKLDQDGDARRAG